MDAFANSVSLNQMWVCSLMHRDSPTLMLIVSVGWGVGNRRSHLKCLCPSGHAYGFGTLPDQAKIGL